MKKLLLAAAAFLAAILFAPAVLAQSGGNYTLTWSTVDGGGGTSTGGVYSISGTIGQPDAGHCAGGNYTLDGGFWGIIVAIPTPGAPRLTITRSGANVIISWPSPSTGFVLQQNADLGTANWTAVPQTPADDGTTKSITLPVGPGSLFLRLKK